MAYDSGNIFARIIRGEIPSTKVFEDAATLAFMDIMPRTEGHFLVLPKAPAANLYEIEPADLASLMATVRRLAIAAKKGLKADGITIHQFNDEAGGQSVFHLHFHVLPRWHGRPLGPHGGPKASPEALAATAQKIAGAIG